MGTPQFPIAPGPSPAPIVYPENCESKVWRQIWGLITSSADIISLMGSNPTVRRDFGQDDDTYPRIIGKLSLIEVKKKRWIVGGHLYLDTYTAGTNNKQTEAIASELILLFNSSLLLPPTIYSTAFRFKLVDNMDITIPDAKLWRKQTVFWIQGCDRKLALASVNRIGPRYPGS